VPQYGQDAWPESTSYTGRFRRPDAIAPASTITKKALCIMPESKDKPAIETSAQTGQRSTSTRRPRRWQPSFATRTILMLFVGFIAFCAVSFVVLYQHVRYGDAIENFGIVMMLTVPVIAAVAFRVTLDTWLDAE
jgi:hypothetical protein